MRDISSLSHISPSVIYQSETSVCKSQSNGKQQRQAQRPDRQLATRSNANKTEIKGNGEQH